MRTVPILIGLAAAGLVALTACGSGAPPVAAAATGSSQPPQTTASVRPAVPTTVTAAPTTAPATITTSASATASATATASTTVQATRKVVLAPVTARGVAVAGYRVVREDSTVDCPALTPSPVSLSRNVYACSPSAAGADVCWASATAGHVLCLRDPRAKVLAELKLAAPLRPARATATPQPLGLELSDGDHCRIRDGGAWGRPAAHPDYVGFYSCTKHEAVWGAKAGINMGSPTWTVVVGGDTGPLVTRNVLKAYYVTTAG
jgi:hypothetical protein